MIQTHGSARFNETHDAYEVYGDESKPAWLHFIHAVNGRTEPPVFGEPTFDHDDPGYLREVYGDADVVIPVRKDRYGAWEDYTRVVAKTPSLFPLWDEIYTEMVPHLRMRPLHQPMSVDPELDALFADEEG